MQLVNESSESNVPAVIRLSVVIPAHNEQGCIESTLRQLSQTLLAEKITHEIIVVNDNSSDSTETILIRLIQEISSLRYVNNSPPHGFGFAVKKGLDLFVGESVAVYMADASDSPEDFQGVRPILSQHFNLTVELPLKAIIRGFSFKVIPNSWVNRKPGVSKLKIKEMGSHYLFIIVAGSSSVFL